MLNIRQQNECHYDLVALGEVMLRFDPGAERISSCRSFQVWEGGGEYNVSRAIRRCFGMRSMVVTALVDNPVGRLIEDFILQGGVDSSFIQWREHDGTGAAVRNGLNFTERGFGLRAARGVSDRANSAASQMKVGAVDWQEIFNRRGSRWFHSGGIFAALSDDSAELLTEACAVAKENGAVVSYDLNYRPSLWQRHGGKERARLVNRKILPFVDVLFGNEEDFFAGLGVSATIDEKMTLAAPAASAYQQILEQTLAQFPNIKVAAASLRGVKTATSNNWGGLCWADGSFHQARQWPDLEIYDRVGGGDSFASGLIYGLLTGKNYSQALEYGVVHGALAMTTPGDTSQATLAEIEKLLAGGSIRIDR